MPNNLCLRVMSSKTLALCSFSWVLIQSHWDPCWLLSLYLMYCLNRLGPAGSLKDNFRKEQLSVPLSTAVFRKTEWNGKTKLWSLSSVKSPYQICNWIFFFIKRNSNTYLTGCCIGQMRYLRTCWALSWSIQLLDKYESSFLLLVVSSTRTHRNTHTNLQL